MKVLTRGEQNRLDRRKARYNGASNPMRAAHYEWSQTDLDPIAWGTGQSYIRTITHNRKQGQ